MIGFLSVIMVVASACPSAVSEADARAIGSSFMGSLWGASKENGIRLYEDVRGEPGVYLTERLLNDGTSVTLMIGARTDMPPVLLYYRGRSSGIADDLAARAAAERALGRGNARRVASVYYSPLDLWTEYEAGEKRVMISLRDLSVCDPARVRSVEPLVCSETQGALFEQQWSDYRSGRSPIAQDGQYRIPDVPDWEWHYGCAPTAAANVLTYWARRGYDLLVDSVRYNVPDPIEGDVDSVPNVSQQLAQAMATDTLVSGSTSTDSIPIGIAAVCADPVWGNNYYFTSYLVWNARELLLNEINNNRPGLLCLVGHPDYGNHAVTFCGWGPPDEDWIVVHDGWLGAPQDKVIYYDYGGPLATVPVIPGRSLAPDVGVTAIVQPGALLKPGTITPQGWVTNFGMSACTCNVFFGVIRPGPGISEGPDDSLHFVSPGWQRFNVDGNPSQWDAGSSVPLDPAAYAVCRREGSLRANDDWLMTPRIRVAPSDTLHYLFRALGTDIESVEVRISYTDSAPESFNQTVRTLRFNNRNRESGCVPFNAIGDTCLYVGFRYVMPPETRGTGVCLESIRLNASYYTDSARVALLPGQALPVVFSPRYTDVGHYVARCSVYQAADKKPDNNTVTQNFQVILAGQDTGNQTTHRCPDELLTLPNPATGIFRVMGWHGPAQVGVYDAAGRRVLSCRLPANGQIDASGLPIGVYLLRLRQSGSAAAATRFVVAR